MAKTLVCDLSDLPPEIQQQIQQEEAAADGGQKARQPVATGLQDPQHQAEAQPPKPAAATSGKPKRNALKSHKKVAAQGDELVSMNVRLTREAYDAVQDMADEYDVSKAMVIRLALSGHMGDHFASMRFSDDAQAAAIRADIKRVNDNMDEIGHQLRRIGKNYNDALRLAHAAAKQGDGQATVPEMDPDLINRMIDRYNAITERLGDMLWRILK